MQTKGALGVILIAVGLTVAVGSISGNLGPMLAALFDPADLVSSSGGKVSSGKSGSSLPGWLKDALALHPLGIGL